MIRSDRFIKIQTSAPDRPAKGRFLFSQSCPLFLLSCESSGGRMKFSLPPPEPVGFLPCPPLPYESRLAAFSQKGAVQFAVLARRTAPDLKSEYEYGAAAW